MFDAKHILPEIIKQAHNFIPGDLEDKKAYIIEKVNFYSLFAEKLLKNINFSEEQKFFIFQIISEWVFHKTIDLYRSKIKEEYIGEILEIIIQHIITILTQSVNQFERQAIIKIVEKEVEKIYNNVINKLPITEGEKAEALKQSNIDNFSTSNKKKITTSIINILSWIIIAVIYANTVLYIGNYFKNSIFYYVIIICCTVVIFNKYISHKYAIEQEKLKKSQKELIELASTDKFYNLNCDEINIEVGKNIINLAITMILPKIISLRTLLAEEKGYIIPKVTVKDNVNLEENTYNVYLHGIKAGSGKIFIDRYMIFEDEIKGEVNIDDIDKIEETLFDKKVYWIKKYDIIQKLNQTKFLMPADVFIMYLKKVVIENADKILSLKDTYNYITTVKDNYSDKIAEKISNEVDIADIQYILSNLIKKNISVKNIGYIFEQIYKLNRNNFTNDKIVCEISKMYEIDD